MFREYPSIINSSRAPRKDMFAFEKLDGSNLRVKYTKKKGFIMFGTRTQALDPSHPHLGSGIELFHKKLHRGTH